MKRFFLLTVFLIGFQSKGAESVHYLISSPASYAGLPELEDKMSVFKMNGAVDYHFVASQLERSRTIVPSFINNSMDWAQERKKWASFNSLSPSLSVRVVISSANKFPYNLELWQSRQSWQSLNFNTVMAHYLLFPDFVRNHSSCDIRISLAGLSFSRFCEEPLFSK